MRFKGTVQMVVGVKMTDATNASVRHLANVQLYIVSLARPWTYLHTWHAFFYSLLFFLLPLFLSVICPIMKYVYFGCVTNAKIYCGSPWLHNNLSMLVSVVNTDSASFSPLYIRCSLIVVSRRSWKFCWRKKKYCHEFPIFFRSFVSF